MRYSLQAWTSAALLFLVALFFFTRENRFPFYYHPDEPGKVRQVQTAEWNYHHPMLMLSTARGITLATASPEQLAQPQHVVEVGRWLSAIFCAGAVVLLSMMVWMIAGPVAAMITGALMIANQQFFELAHYFKEDTALLFGIAAWFFALALYNRRPSAGTAFALGAGAALALSGKFLGAFTIALSLVLLPLGIEKGRRLKAFAAFFVGVIALYILCNLPVFTNFSDFKAGLDREVKMVVEGQRGTTRSVPHDVYLTAFQKNIFFLFWIPLFIYYARCWKRRQKLTLLEWTVALFPIAYMAILSFSPKTNDRYFLPATALFLCGVGMGIDRLRRRWPTEPPVWLPVESVRRLRKIWPRTLALWALIVAVALIQLPDLYKYYKAFRHDDLKDLTAWLNTELPDATLAIDRKVMLPSPRRERYREWLPPVEATVVERNIESFDSIRQMREQGVTHIVLSESSYGRYQLRDLRPQAGAEKKFQKNIDLYSRLKRDNIPLWYRPRSTVIYLHPGLEVYALPQE